MKQFEPGAPVVLNEKVKPIYGHKSWMVPGRRARVMEVAHENRRRGNRWYLVQLFGKKGENAIGRCKVPSNWLDRRP